MRCIIYQELRRWSSIDLGPILVGGRRIRYPPHRKRRAEADRFPVCRRLPARSRQRPVKVVDVKKAASSGRKSCRAWSTAATARTRVVPSNVRGPSPQARRYGDVGGRNVADGSVDGRTGPSPARGRSRVKAIGPNRNHCGGISECCQKSWRDLKFSGEAMLKTLQHPDGLQVYTHGTTRSRFA